MTDSEWLADRFEEHRPRLRSVAYRMLGSLTEADDAVQEPGCGSAGRSGRRRQPGRLADDDRRARLPEHASRAQPATGGVLEEHLPDPVVSPYGEAQPEEQALLADSVGLALLIVLDTLTPAERLAFVLHDMFGLPFDEIAPMVDRTPEATRQLASRARRRVKGAEVRLPTRTWPVSARSSMPSSRRRAGVTWMGSSRSSIRTSCCARTTVTSARSGCSVAQRRSPAGHARSLPGAEVQPALVNGAAGAVIIVRGRPFAILGFTVSDGRIVEIDGILGAERVRRIAASVLRAPGV